jgi:hypothetical protein
MLSKIVEMIGPFIKPENFEDNRKTISLIGAAIGAVAGYTFDRENDKKCVMGEFLLKRIIQSYIGACIGGYLGFNFPLISPLFVIGSIDYYLNKK